MKIAVIGTGIAGLTAARLLHRRHEITVFEAGDWIGGHTHTVAVEAGGREFAVDTGFIVFNQLNYPHFTRLLDDLGVASQLTEMSFSVKNEATGLEYNGHNLNRLFAQRRNLLRPSFHRMIRDIIRFNRRAKANLAAGALGDQSFGEWLDRGGYGPLFLDNYILPMGAALWSCTPATVRSFPAYFFIRFLSNHRMLEIDDRPEWRTVRGGSWRYVETLCAPFKDRIRLGTPVARVRREPDAAWVTPIDGAPERFDAVVLAVHSDQALRMLADPSAAESAILGAIDYGPSEAVLHTDTSLLPRARRAWAAWNYHVTPETTNRVMVTYNMNILQRLQAPETFLVTLNRADSIDPARILGRWTYHHPIFTPDATAAQARHGEINGVNRSYYCGAYWRNGFHEDGAWSAIRALDALVSGGESVVATAAAKGVPAVPAGGAA